MNGRQQAKYRGHWAEWTTPIHRMAGCSHCNFQTGVSRRGQAGGALASAAKLRGLMMEHMRQRHPDKLSDVNVRSGLKALGVGEQAAPLVLEGQGEEKGGE